ncbi:MAG: hypothetical protein ACPGYT_05030 [Nitrospirales bacterium]
MLILIVPCLLLGTACTRQWAYEARPGLIYVGTFVVFYDSEGPLSFQTMTPQEIPHDAVAVGEVIGDSCQHGLSLPIFLSGSDRFSISGAKGDGSYKKALLNIQEKHPMLAGLYDVKVDIHQWSILTYSQECTVVVAQGFTHSQPHNPLRVSARN